jgi:FtsP/CotA-like multicopper oxidase with cupredoxin domain
VPQSPTPTRRIVLGQILTCLTVLPTHAENTLANNGFRSLEARDGSLRLLPEPAPKTPVLTYDGVVPGPLIRCTRGDELALRLVNKLDQPVTFSLQGLRVPNAMAGVAGLTQPAVAPGESFDYRFTARDSGVSWYHSHVLPRTAEQVGRGLYGALIVDEPNPPIADRDMLVLLSEWTLDDQALARVDPAGSAQGHATPLLTVTSQRVPLREILPPRSRVRLRIASTVSSQVLPLGITGAKPLVLAVDGAPCDAFEPARGTVPVGPGALYDVMLDLADVPGNEVRIVLRGEPELPLVVFAAQGEPRAELPPIASLEPNASLPSKIKLEAARRADLTIEAADDAGHWKLNGVAADKPLFIVKRGTPVSLGFVNRTSSVHQMRVHGHYVRILHDLDDGWEPYWRNSVLVPPGKTKRVAFLAEVPGKWPIEGLMHESRSFGLATWFEVT